MSPPRHCLARGGHSKRGQPQEQTQLWFFGISLLPKPWDGHCDSLVAQGRAGAAALALLRVTMRNPSCSSLRFPNGDVIPALKKGRAASRKGQTETFHQ